MPLPTLQMPTRRSVLIGLASVATGSGSALASGAFSETNKTRTTSVSIVGDPEGTLGLRAENDVANDDGMLLELDFERINANGRTLFDPVFSITNNGDHARSLSIEDDLGDLVSFEFENGDTTFDSLDPNESIAVSVTIDTTDGQTPVSGSVTISASDT